MKILVHNSYWLDEKPLTSITKVEALLHGT